MNTRILLPLLLPVGMLFIACEKQSWEPNPPSIQVEQEKVLKTGGGDDDDEYIVQTMVKDADTGDPLENALVQVMPSGQSVPISSGVTDGTGTEDFLLATDTYVIKVIATGQADWISDPISVVSNQVINVEM